MQIARTPSGTTTAGIVVGAALVASMAFLLFRAGRALAANGQSPFRWAWIALAAVTLLGPQIYRAYSIPTGAMEDTLLIGDQILVRVAGAPAPSRGGLVVFRYPVDINQTFVKRVMGVPGDRIRLVNKAVYLNGKKLDEPYAYHKTAYIDSYRDNFPSVPNVHLMPAGQEMLDRHVVNGEIVVPPGNYFVLGDNRDASLDSRYWGFVPRANLIGTPSIIYWSYDAPFQASAGLDLADRYTGFFSRTRWRRIFMPVRGYAIQ